MRCAIREATRELLRPLHVDVIVAATIAEAVSLAKNSREHNDANVLTLGAKLIAPEAAREIVALWLSTPFAGGRHQRRVDKIRSIEERSAKK